MTLAANRGLILFFLSSAVSGGLLPAQCVENASDRAFFAPGYGDLGAPGIPGPPSTILIDRVVGPGTAGEFDSEGLLTDYAWNTYVANGVLSRNAYLLVNLAVIDGTPGFRPGRLSVYVNGHAASESVTVPDAFGWKGCVRIGTRYLKFAMRGQNGQRPQPVSNAVSFIFTPTGGSDWARPIVSTGLRFDAMYPLVLVHGIHADATWFSSNGFLGPLGDAKVPYALAKQPPLEGMSPGKIVDTGNALKTIIPRLAHEFGVNKVHIVAHSKGGLWSRYFLQRPGPYTWDFTGPLKGDEFGVLSLITLDTPHRGSVLADIATAAITSSAGKFTSPARVGDFQPSHLALATDSGSHLR